MDSCSSQQPAVPSKCAQNTSHSQLPRHVGCTLRVETVCPPGAKFVINNSLPLLLSFFSFLPSSLSLSLSLIVATYDRCPPLPPSPPLHPDSTAAGLHHIACVSMGYAYVRVCSLADFFQSLSPPSPLRLVSLFRASMTLFLFCS